MIHKALSKTEIAFRYYRAVAPERKYNKEAARKQFNQDRDIDSKVISKIVDQIFKEQKELLKHH
jgi:hypothetical protein